MIQYAMRGEMLFFILTAILYGVDPRTERYPAGTRVRVSTCQGVRIVSPRGVIEFLVRLDDLLFGLQSDFGRRSEPAERPRALLGAKALRNTMGP